MENPLSKELGNLTEDEYQLLLDNIDWEEEKDYYLKLFTDKDEKIIFISSNIKIESLNISLYTSNRTKNYCKLISFKK